MYKDGILTINDWQKGIAKSPVLGNGHIVNSDIFETEGLLKIGKGVEDETLFVAGNRVNALPIASVRIDNKTSHALLLSNGRYITTNGDNYDTALSSGFDMVEWNGYLIMSGISGSSGAMKIGLIDNTSDPESFTGYTIAITGLATTPIMFCKGSDGVLYFTNGNKIGKITSISIPSSVCVPVYDVNILDMPTGEVANSISEIGSNLIIGTMSNKLNPRYETIANLYIWDRVSASYNLPVKLQENAINAIKTKDNLAYISAGVNGNIYVSNGTSYRLLTQVKTTKRNRGGGESFVYPNAMTFNKNGKLLIGTSTFTDGTPNNTTFQGVWEIDINNGNYHLLNTIPSGEIGQNNSIFIGYVEYYNDEVLFGYTDTVNSKFMTCTTSFRLSSLSSFESPLYIVGDYANKKAFTELQWLFVKPLQLGQKIKIYVRDGIEGDWNNENWRLIHESTSVNEGKYSTIVKPLIASSEVLQFKVELLNTNNATIESCELLRVLLK